MHRFLRSPENQSANENVLLCDKLARGHFYNESISSKTFDTINLGTR